MTVNNLRALQVAPGLPRMMVARAMLDMPDVASALAYLQQAPRSGGFHITLAQAGNRTLTGVEFHAGVCSAMEIERPALHANHMIQRPGKHDGVCDNPGRRSGHQLADPYRNFTRASVPSEKRRPIVKFVTSTGERISHHGQSPHLDTTHCRSIAQTRNRHRPRHRYGVARRQGTCDPGQACRATG
ncbi:hypothetical protein EGT07_21450 [Herbaspirillum sp. HC18]|nr:hypothetical protein EGT07_21450 [Herbaspirillum sp. HC18]